MGIMGLEDEKLGPSDQDSEIKIKIEEDSDSEKGDKGAAEKPLEKMKKSELIQKIAELEEECAKSNDRCLRSQAEMENIKKRMKKEKEDWVKYSNETLIKGILPVIDNLEQAITHSHNENALPALREGVELTIKGLKDVLAKSGLEDVNAVGEPFDPLFHEAVSEQEDENIESGSVLMELQKGYRLHGRLIRPSMVIVSKGKSDNSKESDTRSNKGIK